MQYPVGRHRAWPLPRTAPGITGMTETTRMTDRLWRVALRVAWRLLRLWWFVRRPHIEGVYVAVWHGGRLLVVRNSYKSYATVPGGGVYRGEPRATAAARELREEAGIDVDPSALRLALDDVLFFEHKHDHATVYEIDLPAAPVPRVDGREVISAAFLAPEEALARSLSPVVRRYLVRREESPGASR